MTLAQVRQRVSEEGLSDTEAEKIRQKTGPNEWKRAKKAPLIVRFFAQWKDFMILTLVCAAIVSAAASYLNGELALIDPLVILAIITFNASLGVAQEARAEKSLEALRRLAAPTALVRRGGHERMIPAAELVPGDVVKLDAGCYVPADGRLLAAVNLKIEESSLTGESLPVEKNAGAVCPSQAAMGDRYNMAMAGTCVVHGRGTMVVTAIGMQTEAGKIAKQVMEEVPPPTPLQKRLDETGKKLGAGALAICVIVFIVGALRQFPLFDMFMVAVSLAVAAIPEGLSAVVTILLSQGVQRMARKHAVTRRLPAVETLGSTTVICSDKTGTLTQNHMHVRRLAGVDGEIQPESERGRQLLAMAALCCDATWEGERAVGEATETAIVEAAERAGIHKQTWEQKYPRCDEIPFDSERKRMTTVHERLFGEGGIVMKGAPEVVLPRCRFYEAKGAPQPMSETIRRQFLEQNEAMAARALRVIAVAWRPACGDKRETYEQRLIFGGFLGLMDPPRPEAKEAIRVCSRAGIRTVMITGDHVQTARAIAQELGMMRPGAEAVTGQELSVMTEEELRARVGRIAVYARVAPEHKVRVVRALQACGEVVAMTGDGVNDAPALKAADIGCAMGASGTDVAKNTADMVLTDDNFATIVAAVREGRVIYDNIRKAIHFLLATNIGEIVCIFAAVMMGLPSPLLATQLLWVNLVTDSLPAVAIGMEPAEPGLMERRPIPQNTSMFAGGMAGDIALEGLLIGALALLAFWWGCRDSLEVGRTVAFGVLSLTELFHAMNMRSRTSLLRIGLFSNKMMLLAMAVCVGLQIAVMTVPPAAAMFQTVPLTVAQWAGVFGISLVPIAAMELQKRLRG